MAFRIRKCTRLHQEGLEADEHLPRHDLEPVLRLIRLVERVHRIPQSFDPRESSCAAETVRIESQTFEVCLSRLNGLEEHSHQFLNGSHDPTGIAAFVLVPERLRKATSYRHR